MSSKRSTSSWDASAEWYCRCVGEKGHHYHQHVVIPSLLRLLQLSPTSQLSLLDLGCGPGILSTALPSGVTYYGVDLSTRFIQHATSHLQQANRHFFVGDVTKTLPFSKKDFDVACLILSLQNMEHKQEALRTAIHHLSPQGKLLIVLNHPCFRIPRQSSWGIDEPHQIQYRRIDRYLSSQKIPIQTHPSQHAQSEVTYSFHDPLCRYMQWLKSFGYVISDLEEWCSDKTSKGATARRENRARQEIPLFLGLVAVKSTCS